MPIDCAFFEKPALVCFRYSGHISTDELSELAIRLGKVPNHKLNRTHFLDLSGVVSHKIDFTEFLLFMAKLADIYPTNTNEHLFVYYAPPGKPAELAEMARRSWEGNGSILIRIAETRAQAFDILGVPRQDLPDYLDAFT